MLLRTFGWSIAITIAGLAVALWYGSVSGMVITAILIVLEVSLSFDNAVVNAKVLGRMNDWWQRVFLTVGMIVAVFGMRLVFPLIIVGVTAHLSPWKAWQLALEKGDPEEPGTYGYLLSQSHVSIAAFGGMFLLMIFLDFLIDEDKELHWIDHVERLFAKVGLVRYASILIALLVLAGFSFSTDADVRLFTAGIWGLITYLLVNGLAGVFAKEDDDGKPSTGATVALAGKAAFSLFVYLEVLDASFSFDGVIGAFAITADPVIIALGLGIGALYVRSLTIFLVRKGTLSEFVYLEHGAHWAIGALAILLFVSIEHEVPEVVTGLIGVAFIALSIFGSVRFRKHFVPVAHQVRGDDRRSGEDDRRHGDRRGSSIAE